MKTDIFYATLRHCESLINDALMREGAGQVQFDFTSRLYAEGIRRDISLIEAFCNKNSRILDFGCGRGTISVILSVAGFEVEGIDLAVPPEVGTMKLLSTVLPFNLQKKVWKTFQENFDVQFMFYDGEHFPFNDDVFSAVVAHAVIEHIVKEKLETVVEEMRRVLKKGGRVLVSKLPRSQSVIEKSAKILGLHTHQRVLSEKEVVDLFTRQEFKVLSIERTDMIPKLYILPKRFQNLLNSLYPFASALDSTLLKTPFSYFADNLRLILEKPSL